MNGPALTEEEFFRGMPQTKPSNELQERILAGVDKIVITKNDYRDDTPPSLVIANPEDVAKFIALLEMDETAELFYCMCSGDWRIDFFSGEQLKTSYTLHHGTTIRSHFWWGNATLRSPEALFQFVADSGFPLLLDQFIEYTSSINAIKLAQENGIDFDSELFRKIISQDENKPL